MKRYIANYTILSSGELFINHITTINDDDTMVSILPFDREMGNTRYVNMPMCIATHEMLNTVKETFRDAANLNDFVLRLKELHKQHLENQDATITPPKEPVAILTLNFSTGTISRI